MSAGAAIRYPSPLRYPGGKGKLANFVKLIYLKNDLLGRPYVEPYAGGAGVALALLFEDFASQIHINDIDRSIFAFWSAVLDETDALCSRIRKTHVSVDEWLRQKAVQSANEPDTIDLAFSTFFLNRTNRSGIISSGGIIGGLKQNGAWAIDARFNKDELIRRIQKVARFRSRITLTRMDAATLLKSLIIQATELPVVYLDPPYYNKGPALYANFYSHEHHLEIAHLVSQLPVPWIVSYDATREIAAMYRFSRSRRYELDHTAGQHRMGSEIMFFSKELTIPRGQDLACVPTSVVDRARVQKVLG